VLSGLLSSRESAKATRTGKTNPIGTNSFFKDSSSANLRRRIPRRWRAKLNVLAVVILNSRSIGFRDRSACPFSPPQPVIGSRLSSHTEGHYKQYVASLSCQFGKRLVCDITAEDICELQALRQSQGKSGRTINAMGGVLRQIFKHQNLRALHADRARFFRERRDIGRAISVEDEAKLLDSMQGSRSPSLMPLFVVSIDTGLRASELRNPYSRFAGKLG